MIEPQTIQAAAFCKILAEGQAPAVLDVRTEIEHKACHVCGPHSHIPLDVLDVDAWVKSNALKAGDRVYVLCASGKRAGHAANLLVKRGMNAVIVEGGLKACMENGIETRGQKVISLERQVRIAAGIFVLLGVVLGATVVPAFYGISAAIGAGLVFAGLTDWCGMALLLAKAPWNVDRTKQAAMASLCKFEQKTKGV